MFNFMHRKLKRIESKRIGLNARPCLYYTDMRIVHCTMNRVSMCFGVFMRYGCYAWLLKRIEDNFSVCEFLKLIIKCGASMAQV